MNDFYADTWPVLSILLLGLAMITYGNGYKKTMWMVIFSAVVVFVTGYATT
ncbi:TPA: hypothetical protein I8627_004584 [Citrobacter freundii]|uniref:hypothetical protein n=1 Tax=Pseudocitrobacter faecalis TaxID=1398493 RepID=UPI001A1B63BC|nr:hypothetical protein [Citrobacter freundii]HAT3771692.1 hypothetical protein [Citrobacter freundii]